MRREFRGRFQVRYHRRRRLAVRPLPLLGFSSLVAHGFLRKLARPRYNLGALRAPVSRELGWLTYCNFGLVLISFRQLIPIQYCCVVSFTMTLAHYMYIYPCKQVYIDFTLNTHLYSVRCTVLPMCCVAT